MRTFLFVSLAVGLLLLRGGHTRAQDEPRAIIEKAVQACGGTEKLAKLNTVWAKGKGTIEFGGASLPFMSEGTVQLPGRLKSELHIEVDGKKVTLIQVCNGDKGWLSVGGNTIDLEGKLLAEMKESMHAARVEALTPLLKEKTYSLALLGPIKVNGRDAVGVRVSSKGFKDVNLFFDKANGLLVKSERRALDNNQMEVAREMFYTDYKEIDGLKRPTKFLANNDGKKFIEGEMTEIKFLDKLDDSTFAKP